jgi:hypothetical protein
MLIENIIKQYFPNLQNLQFENMNNNGIEMFIIEMDKIKDNYLIYDNDTYNNFKYNNGIYSVYLDDEIDIAKIHIYKYLFKFENKFYSKLMNNWIENPIINGL